VSEAKRPTISDVAAAARVSKATVSAVLNDVPGVKDATRERVLAAMEGLNYRPAPGVGRRGAAARPRCIALVLKEHDNPYYAAVIEGARSVLDPDGHTLVVVSSEGSSAAERREVTRLRGMDVDGFLVTPVLDDAADLSHFFELRRRNVPFVFLEHVRGVQASLVDVDNVAVTRAAVEHLLALGHTHVVHFAGPAYSWHSHERAAGVRRAYSGTRLVLRDEDVVPTGAHLADGYRAGLATFRDRPIAERPTAVVCYNDLVAVGLCRALQELGLRVPEDVSVVGYDDIPLCEYLAVPLTTVRVPMHEMGATAARLLLRHLDARGPLEPTRVALEAGLVVRASTAPPRPHALGEPGPRRDGAGGVPAALAMLTPDPADRRTSARVSVGATEEHPRAARARASPAATPPAGRLAHPPA
jgi:DNA-binding LacI/PurR family transcriptional regulator